MTASNDDEHIHRGSVTGAEVSQHYAEGKINTNHQHA